jgi:hypothetical protein
MRRKISEACLADPCRPCGCSSTSILAGTRGPDAEPRWAPPAEIWSSGVMASCSIGCCVSVRHRHDMSRRAANLDYLTPGCEYRQRHKLRRGTPRCRRPRHRRSSRGEGCRGCLLIPIPQFPTPVLERRLGQTMLNAKHPNRQTTRLPRRHPLSPLLFTNRIPLTLRHDRLLDEKSPRVARRGRRYFAGRACQWQVGSAYSDSEFVGYLIVSDLRYSFSLTSPNI